MRNHFGAELPAESLDAFQVFKAWWESGKWTEVEIDDEAGIAQVQALDPRRVVSLAYLGTRGSSSMFLMPGFLDPDTDDVERWFISEQPVQFGDFPVAADFMGDCTLCRNSLEFESGSETDCEMCAGDDSVQYWFEDFIPQTE